MHQPYYKNLLTGESSVPWVRLHGIKDYLDMVKMLEIYPKIHQTFNLVPSLIEQVEDYNNNAVKDRFLELSYKKTAELTPQEKEFILNNFFMINKERVISLHPRYYELYQKKQAKKEFTQQDLCDLQVWFNLSWTDPYFRQNIPELRDAVNKARFFTQEDKNTILNKQSEILKGIIPAYKKLADSGQIEATISPYYHPILPLLYNTNVAKEANTKTILPKTRFSYPADAKAQIDMAVKFFQDRFGAKPCGMWPSEEAVSEHILPLIIESGINWIVTDEALLFKSLKKKKRDTSLLYQPHLLKREEGNLNIVFRDRNLSDLIGFVYQSLNAKDAVSDFMKHLENINKAFSGKDILVTIAMDGENAWEYYPNDGQDFLELLYQTLSDSKIITTVTVKEYLERFKPKLNIERLAAGSWIYGEFGKWIGNPLKVRAWEYLAQARAELEQKISDDKQFVSSDKFNLAWKQMHILEGSDWFWWYGEDPTQDFDRLFRMHLSNFYSIIEKDIPEYLNKPLQ